MARRTSSPDGGCLHGVAGRNRSVHADDGVKTAASIYLRGLRQAQNGERKTGYSCRCASPSSPVPSAKRREEDGVFVPLRFSVKPRSTRWGSAASIDDDDDGPRVSPPNQELEPTIRRALGEVAPSLHLPWNERRRRCGVAPRIRRRPDRDRRTASTNEPSDGLILIDAGGALHPCAQSTINREGRTTVCVRVAATAADSSAPAQPAVISSSKRTPRPTPHRPRAENLPAHRPRQAFKSRRATATRFVPIYCEGIEALGTLRWS
jgi:hypothetical protein